MGNDKQKGMDLRQLVSIMSECNYAIDLSTVDQTQILYNGKFSYLNTYQNPHSGGWCHLLVLRSKNSYSKQLLTIITQTSDCGVSIVNTIEHIATFAINFFINVSPPYPREDEEDTLIDMLPENTIFVEYLPAGIWPLHDTDDLAVMDFSWEQKPFGQGFSLYHAESPPHQVSMWRSVRIDTINDLIARL